MFAANEHCEQRVAHGVPLNLLAILCAMPSQKSDMSNSLAISSLFFALSSLLTGTFYWFAATTQQDFVVAKRSHSLVAFYSALNYLFNRLFLAVASFWVASIEVKRAPDILLIWVDVMAGLT